MYAYTAAYKSIEKVWDNPHNVVAVAVLWVLPVAVGACSSQSVLVVVVVRTVAVAGVVVAVVVAVVVVLLVFQY
jgi:hypothetical protein